MSSNNVSKRRALGNGGYTALPDRTNTHDSNGQSYYESRGLYDMAMEELLDHCRSQTKILLDMENEIRLQRAEMDSMKGQMNLQTSEMASMRDEMHRLAKKCNTAEAAFQGIMNRVDSRLDMHEKRQKYHQIMIKNQKYEYKVAHPRLYGAEPDGFRDSTQHDRSLVRSVESFFEQVKRETCKMRHGEGTGNVSLMVNVPYRNIFISHWEEFADALEEHQFMLDCLEQDEERSPGLQLYDVDLSHPYLRQILSKALQKTHFKRFSLMNNNLGHGNIDFALDYVAGNKLLQSFKLARNTIDSVEDANWLCEIIKDHPSINQLSLVQCFGEDIPVQKDMLSSIIAAGRSKLQCLHYSCNSVQKDEMSYLSDILATDPILDTLILSNNGICDQDVFMIANALKSNTNLRTLILDNNHITAEGWSALRRAEFDCTSLNSAASSNHTCGINYGDVPHGQTYINNREFNTCAVRAKKIYAVLTTRNELNLNVCYFDKVPVTLLPAMLESTQKYSKYHLLGELVSPEKDKYAEPLSIVYEVLRGWDKAMSVYESLGSLKA